MKTPTLIIILLAITIMVCCERSDSNLDQYFSAVIDGKEFTASHFYAYRKMSYSTEVIEILASSHDVFDSTFSYESMAEIEDWKLFELTFRRDCVDERVFSLDEIKSSGSCVEFLYEFNDSNIKGITPDLFQSDGFIEIKSYDNKLLGIISGEFKINAWNYGPDGTTDPIKIKNGKFRLQINDI